MSELCANPECGHTLHVGHCSRWNCPCTSYSPSQTAAPSLEEMKAAVKAVHPEADCVTGRVSYSVFATMPPPPFDPKSLLLGRGPTALAAWIDAYAKLPAPDAQMKPQTAAPSLEEATVICTDPAHMGGKVVYPCCSGWCCSGWSNGTAKLPAPDAQGGDESDEFMKFWSPYWIVNGRVNLPVMIAFDAFKAGQASRQTREDGIRDGEPISGRVFGCGCVDECRGHTSQPTPPQEGGKA